LELWLRNEHLPKDERLERLAHDADLISDLHAAGFVGDDWDFFANELSRYGMAVIGGWMHRGIITAKCAEKNVQVRALPEAVRRDPSAIDAVCGETVAAALQRFRDDVLIPGSWDPAKGASVRTFFIRQCMFRYGNILKAFINHELPTANVDDPHDDFDAFNSRVSGVEDDAIRTVTAQFILKGAVSERAARALAMDACRYTNAEIAEDLGISVAALSSLLKRERARLSRTQSPGRTGTA
jgi:hypothetical protein